MLKRLIINIANKQVNKVNYSKTSLIQKAVQLTNSSKEQDLSHLRISTLERMPLNWPVLEIALRKGRANQPVAPVDVVGCNAIAESIVPNVFISGSNCIDGAELMCKNNEVIATSNSVDCMQQERQKQFRFVLLVALLFSSQTKDGVTSAAVHRLNELLIPYTHQTEQNLYITTDSKSDKRKKGIQTLAVKVKANEVKNELTGNESKNQTDDEVFNISKDESKESTTSISTAKNPSVGLTIHSIRAFKQDNPNDWSQILADTIKPVGFHHRKIQYLSQIVDILHDQYQGDIPQSLQQLMSLPGIGPKMALLARQHAWGMVDGIAVDLHVHRLSARLGLVPSIYGMPHDHYSDNSNVSNNTCYTDKTEGKNEYNMDASVKHTNDSHRSSQSKTGKKLSICKTPEQTRAYLEKTIPSQYWHRINHELVAYGQTVCSAVRPKCTECCPLTQQCLYYQQQQKEKYDEHSTGIDDENSTQDDEPNDDISTDDEHGTVSARTDGNYGSENRQKRRTVRPSLNKPMTKASKNGKMYIKVNCSISGEDLF